MNSANIATHINCYIFRSTYGERGQQLIRRVEFLLERNGVEWFVERQKAITQAALLLKAGDREQAISIYQRKSIAYTRKGYPKDVWGEVVRHFVESDHPKTMKKMLGLLRCYTAYTVRKLTRKQYDKLYKAINEPVKSECQPNIQLWALMIEDYAKTIRSRIYPDGIVIKDSDMFINKLSPFTATHVQGLSAKLYKEIPYANVVASLMTCSSLPQSLHKLIPSVEMIGSVKELNEHHKVEEFVGRIHTIQEKGCKARTVAIPNSWVQLAFFPIHKILQQVSERYFARNSCMMDQKRGIVQVLKHFDNGHNVVSVDLSSATDRFPRALQTAFLRGLALDPWADALEEIATGKWIYPQGRLIEGGETIFSYSAGQPMGMYGSFPLFHTTHMCLVEAIVYGMRGNGDKLISFPDHSYFKVLGDDIVFSDSNLAKEYIKTITSFGVEYSPQKTFWGGIAEFAGFVAVKAKGPRGTQYVGFRPYKYPTEDRISNPIDFMNTFRQPVSRKPRWERIFEAFSRTASQRALDLSPIYPSDNQFGGSPHKDMVLEKLVSISKGIAKTNMDRFTFADGTTMTLTRNVYCKKPLCPDSYEFRGEGFPEVTPSDDTRVKGNPNYVTARNAMRDPLIRAYMDSDCPFGPPDPQQEADVQYALSQFLGTEQHQSKQTVDEGMSLQ